MYSDKAREHYAEVHDILQEISDALNKGQRQKLLKNEKIKKRFDFYGVVYEGKE